MHHCIFKTENNPQNGKKKNPKMLNLAYMASHCTIVKHCSGSCSRYVHFTQVLAWMFTLQYRVKINYCQLAKCITILVQNNRSDIPFLMYMYDLLDHV